MADDTKNKKPVGKKATPTSHNISNVGFEAALLLFLLFMVIVPIITSIVFGVRGVFENQYVARFILVLKYISGILSVAATIGILYVVAQTAKLRPPITSRVVVTESSSPPKEPKSDGTFQSEWNRIKEKLQTASDNDAAYLIIEADALADDVLKHFRIPGETMGERMDFITGPDMKSSQDFWDAHKMRNQIAHEGAKNVLYVDAVYALEKYEKVLRELNVIA
ncbi:MAG: hypothetical protein AAB482_03165 [Patescibacteria group bacterium]